MALAAAEGARREPDVIVRMLEAERTEAGDMLGADGYIFAAPENLAALSGLMKDFFDRTYYPVLDRINGRAFATLICAGSDGQNALRQVARIAKGWRLRAVTDGVVVCTNAQTADRIAAVKRIGEDELERCRVVGETLAAGLAAGIF